MNSFEAREPDFKGDGIAVWVNEKDGKKYLSIKKPEWTKSIIAFKNEPKQKDNKPTL